LDENQTSAMQNYPWPGNVRELRNIIERAILVRKGPVIKPTQLLGQPTLNPTALPSNNKPGSIDPLENVEKEHIRKALAFYKGNHTHAAKALGISRSTLVRKIKVHQL